MKKVHQSRLASCLVSLMALSSFSFIGAKKAFDNLSLAAYRKNVFKTVCNIENKVCELTTESDTILDKVCNIEDITENTVIPKLCTILDEMIELTSQTDIVISILADIEIDTTVAADKLCSILDEVVTLTTQHDTVIDKLCDLTSQTDIAITHLADIDLDADTMVDKLCDLTSQTDIAITHLADIDLDADTMVDKLCDLTSQTDVLISKVDVLLDCCATMTCLQDATRQWAKDISDVLREVVSSTTTFKAFDTNGTRSHLDTPAPTPDAC